MPSLLYQKIWALLTLLPLLTPSLQNQDAFKKPHDLPLIHSSIYSNWAFLATTLSKTPVSGPCPIRETHGAFWQKNPWNVSMSGPLNSPWFFPMTECPSSLLTTSPFPCSSLTSLFFPLLNSLCPYRSTLGILFIFTCSFWQSKCIYRHDLPHRHLFCFWFICLPWYSWDTSLEYESTQFWVRETQLIQATRTRNRCSGQMCRREYC